MGNFNKVAEQGEAYGKQLSADRRPDPKTQAKFRRQEREQKALELNIMQARVETPAAAFAKGLRAIQPVGGFLLWDARKDPLASVLRDELAKLKISAATRADKAMRLDGGTRAHLVCVDSIEDFVRGGRRKFSGIRVTPTGGVAGPRWRDTQNLSTVAA